MFLLPTAGKFASSMVIRDVLLEQPEEFLASQIKNEVLLVMQLKDSVFF